METTNQKESAINDLSKKITINRNFFVIDLKRYFNNDGISYDDLKCDGDFDGKGGSLPAEELPPSNSLIYVDGIPFHFPSKENGFANNVTLSGQSINIQPLNACALYVLASVDGQHGEVYEEEVTVSLEDGTYHPVYLGISNWLLAPKYSERAAFKCSHLHYPDKGQETILNTKATAELEAYKEFTGNHFLSTPIDENYATEEAKNGIWRPRIWIQKVPLNFQDHIVGFTFMDNLNFHIFAMTVEFEG